MSNPLKKLAASAALRAAAMGLDAETMRAALAAGGEPTSFGHESLAYVIVKAGALLDGNAEARAARQVAALRVIAEHGALDAQTATNTFLAAPPGTHPAVLRCLLGAGMEPRARLPGGDTLLHRVQTPEAARVLIAAGADVNARTASAGSTPLHDLGYYAYFLPRAAELVEVLAAAGADVNAADDHGATVLHTAVAAAVMVRPAFVAATRALLRHGADPTLGPPETTSPLEEALRWLSDSVHSLALSVAHGSDVAVAVDVDLLQTWRRIAKLLAHAAAWRRRRHLLLVVRVRYGGDAFAPDAGAVTGGAGCAAAATAAAGSDDGSSAAGSASC